MTLTEDQQLLQALPSPSTAKQVAARLRQPVREVVPRLYRLRSLGSVLRTVDPETSVARWVRA